MTKVIGIGNALTDIVIPLSSYDLIDELELPHGGMVMIDNEKFEYILNKTKDLEKSYVAGGSAANTTYGLSKLGVDTSFIGKVGDDEIGALYEKDLTTNGIKSLLQKSKSTHTGCAITFVTPDSERTFATYLGAASELSVDDLKDEYFIGKDLLHIEGYLLFNYELVRSVMELAKKHGLKVSLDLAAHNFVMDNRDEITDIVKTYVDVCFANEEESKALTAVEPEKALDVIADYCKYAIVKLGSKGSLVKQGDNFEKIDIVKAVPVDTTGAGDLFASGFLYGLINKNSLKECGNLGSLLGATVIQNYGARINNEDWEKIKSSK